MEMDNALVIVMAGNLWTYEEIKKELKMSDLQVVHVDEIIGKTKVDGKALKRDYPAGRYKDARGNRIVFDESLPDNIRIDFVGDNNSIFIESGISVSSLSIVMGNNGVCKIGLNTEIIDGFFLISDAKLLIGSDCLFSREVVVRTHDGHHIFDINTHKRVNYPKDIVIEDNVWIGWRVTLLGGAHIGKGSVVGANSVTSSRFGEHQIIVGVPAKCIRQDVCWSRDNTDYFNRECLEDCISQEALKYL